MRVLVCGGRDFRDINYVSRVLSTLHHARKIELGMGTADMVARSRKSGVEVVTVVPGDRT